MATNIIFVNGFATTQKIWSMVVNLLPNAILSNGLDINTPSSNALLSSPKIIFISWHNLMKNEALLTNACNSDSIVVGWSFGGMLAVRAIHKHNIPPKQLILLSFTPVMPYGKRIFDAMQKKLNTNREYFLAEFFTNCVSSTMPYEASIEHKNELLAESNLFTICELESGLKEMEQINNTKAIQDVGQHTKITYIHGENDKIVPLSSAMLGTKIISFAGHLLPIQHPNTIVTEIMQYNTPI